MAGLGKASAVVATGTLVSRITGLIRNVVLAAALPPVMNQAADAFAIANQLPNNIYAVISSGLLAGVIVPQIVKAARSKDGGSAFVSKLLTLGVMVMLAVTVVAVVAAPILVFAYGSQMNDPKAFALTIAFAYWCLPQLLFYGMYALVGEVLNARRVFGPYAWSPIVNNIVSIVGFLAFICVFGAQTDAVGWTPEMIAALGATATGGIVAQAVVLFFFWRKTGMHVRPDFRWRGIGLRHIGRLAGWTFLMVIVGQLAGLLQSNLLSSASGEGASIATTQYAWLVFMLPFSVIVLSIGTPYYTQLSEHAAEGRTDAIRGDLDRLTRTVCLFVVGVLAAIVAAILPISRIFSPNVASAVPFAFVLGAYLVALLPLSVQFGIQRTFYAYQDTRTPFLFTAVQAGLVVASAIVAFLLLPVQYLAVGVALGQSLANIVQLSLAIWLLRRKIGPLGLGGAVISLLRFLAAAVPAAAVGWWVYTLVASGVMVEKLNAVVGAALVGGVSLAVYVLALIVLRAPELRVAGRMLRRFLPGGR